MTDEQTPPGRAAAEKALRAASGYANQLAPETANLAELTAVHQTLTAVAGVAQVHSQLAIEERLGELVEQQRISNAIAGVQLLRGYNHAELNQAREKVRDIVRDLLDFGPKTETTSGTETP